MGWYAKALRCYNACQCYAQQITEELEPPADCPEDLGLPEYWGDWGEWESWKDSK